MDDVPDGCRNETVPAETAHAWLTIDARDDTPHLFWRSVSAALAREQILRLGADDLCFDLELTRRFVHLRREDASTGDITRLYERTRGWQNGSLPVFGRTHRR